MAYVVAVDIGGTFTDLVAFDHDTQKVIYTKSPTTYNNLVEGIVDCFGKGKIAPADANFLNHGTTLVINALIQRKGAKTALVTSAGFRDVLEIARANRPDPFDLHYQRDEPLIPRELRFEVPERTDFKGNVIVPLDDKALETLAAELKHLKIEAIAIFFMNSYHDPANELHAAEILRRLLPDVYITCSTELTREWYEYERCSTAAANAYVGPQVNTYIRRLESEFQSKGYEGPIFMMGSNGGLLSVTRTCRQPIALVESGPIGGCIGAGAFAEALGFDNVVAFDMGGTTAKCALVEHGRFAVDSVYYADGYVKGFPVKSPVINIVEVGSGGGSILWLDDQKRIHVGPQSAGSTPGPVCYGRGGTAPTVTDANLILGRLNADRFLGGELTLDPAAAMKAMSEKIAAPLGYPGDQGAIEMAEGSLAIATVVMAGAIRRVSIEHGLDPRDFALFAYGGCGPLHACAIARELSIPTVIIPPEPGNFSAIGMLLADARIDNAKTLTGLLDDKMVETMRHQYGTMEDEAQQALAREFGATEVSFQRHAEMRFRGQRHNIKVELTGLDSVEAIHDAFTRDYKRRYGFADSKAPAEIQVLMVSAFAKLRRPDIARLPRRAGDGRPETMRPVYFGRAGGMVPTKVYDRGALPIGFAASGPAVIEEYGSTTVIGPGDRFEMGPMGEIRVNCTGK